MKKWLIKQLGGFTSFDDALESVKRSDDKAAKHRVLTEAVSHLFNTVSPESILHRDKSGVVLFQGNPVNEKQLEIWQLQADQIFNMRVWFVIKQEIRWQLQKKVFDEANVIDDLVWGKLLIFYDDVLRTVLRKLKKGV